MKLSLSVRVAESPTRKDQTAVAFEDLAPLARQLGYDGLCLRASVVSIESTPERVAQVREIMAGLGLAASMVTGDVPLAANDVRATAALRNIGPYLDLAEDLGSERIRVMMHGAEDVPLARRAADEARERGINLCHQTHWGTTFETVEDALMVVRAVDRPNFGVTYEPANLLVCGGDYGPEAIARLAPHILNVYFQNMRLDPVAGLVHPTRRLGPVRAAYAPIGDRSAIDVDAQVRALKQAGYDGWFTVHQPLQPGQTVPDAMSEAYRAISPLL